MPRPTRTHHVPPGAQSHHWTARPRIWVPRAALRRNVLTLRPFFPPRCLPVSARASICWTERSSRLWAARSTVRVQTCFRPITRPGAACSPDGVLDACAREARRPWIMMGTRKIPPPSGQHFTKYALPRMVASICLSAATALVCSVHDETGRPRVLVDDRRGGHARGKGGPALRQVLLVACHSLGSGGHEVSR